MVKTKVSDPWLLVADTVYVELDVALVGVPETTPVDGSMPIPSGKLGLTLQEFTDAPLLLGVNDVIATPTVYELVAEEYEILGNPEPTEIVNKKVSEPCELPAVTV